MKAQYFNTLQIREVFHLEFLRWFSRKIKPENYAVKGGANLRFFFKSFRYSEDLDLDIRTVNVDKLKETVMDILISRSFAGSMITFGIQKVTAPDMLKAKQTETTQRFKIHLLTAAGEDLFTKIEFSRRGFKGDAVVEPVADTVLRAYKLAPLLIPHYETASAVTQKIGALADRNVTQARDVFDLYVLSSQFTPGDHQTRTVGGEKMKQAHQNIFSITFEQFRDTVVAYLGEEEQKIYGVPVAWDEIRLKTAHFLEELKK